MHWILCGTIYIDRYVNDRAIAGRSFAQKDALRMTYLGSYRFFILFINRRFGLAHFELDRNIWATNLLYENGMDLHIKENLHKNTAQKSLNCVVN